MSEGHFWHWIDIVLGWIFTPELICDRQIIWMGISQLVLCLPTNWQLSVAFSESQPRSEIGLKSVGHQAGGDHFADQTADKYPPKADEQRKSEVSPLTNPEEEPKEIRGEFDNCLGTTLTKILDNISKWPAGNLNLFCFWWFILVYQFMNTNTE